MNKKDNLKDLFTSLQNCMVSDMQLGRALRNSVEKGENSEMNWIEWFNKYLPKRYRAAKAIVIDSLGNTSDQIDIVLYDMQYSYLAYKKQNILRVPAESVYAVFEVKQNLNKASMEYAGKKAESVRNLKRTSAAIPHAGGIYPPKSVHRILAGILTTTSKWNPLFGKPLEKCLAEYTGNQQIDCGCVLQEGAFNFDYSTKKLKKSNQEEALIYFFLQLLLLLQNIGTVPAIDLVEYMKGLDISEKSIDD